MDWGIKLGNWILWVDIGWYKIGPATRDYNVEVRFAPIPPEEPVAEETDVVVVEAVADVTAE